MDTVFGQLDGLTGIAEDIFVYGKSENDQHILNTPDTARENNVKFNPDKFQFKVEETSFFALNWTSQGLKPDDKKIKCIVDMQRPQNLTVTIIHGDDKLPQPIFSSDITDIRSTSPAHEEGSTFRVAT